MYIFLEQYVLPERMRYLKAARKQRALFACSDGSQLAQFAWLQHISSVMALVQNPRMLADMARAFIDPPMRARPAVFVAANALGLWAGQ